MVAVRLVGGLGNQMFIYAAGLSVAIQRNVELYMDLSFLRAEHTGCTKRAYELSAYPIPQRFLADDAAIPLVREASFRFDPQVLDCPDGSCLCGYFQSPRYFDSVRREVLDCFNLVRVPVELSRLVAEIKDTCSVALHVRRGDYFADEAARRIHGVCGPSYYLRSIARMGEILPASVFFVFSDDLPWCEALMPRQRRFVFVETTCCQHDLYLMSLCKHDIISNSAFSWWGQFMNRNPGKVVIAPTRWFTQPGPDSRDIEDESWVRVEV